jgi:hypothetical protein
LGSEQARRHAALMLESFSGACGPLEAAQGMGVALARYYQLEARALQALVQALEPRPRGRQMSDAGSLRKAIDQQRRLERELHRYQALYRAAQKTLGIAPRSESSSEANGGRKKKRRMRKVTRGQRLAQGLRVVASSAESLPQSAAEGSG